MYSIVFGCDTPEEREFCAELCLPHPEIHCEFGDHHVWFFSKRITHLVAFFEEYFNVDDDFILDNIMHNVEFSKDLVFDD